MGAHVSAFWAPIEAKLQQRHDDAQDLAKQQRSSYQGVIQDPNTSDEMKNWAWGEWQKSLHPDARKRFGKMQPIVNQIMGGLGAQTPAGAGGPIPAPNGPVFDTEAANKRTLDMTQKKSDIEQGRQIAVAQAKPQTGTLGKAQEYRNPDDPSAPPITVQQHNRSGQYYDLQGRSAEVPEGYKPYKAPTTGARKQFRYTVQENGKPKEVTVFQDNKTQAMFDIHGKPFELPADAEPVDEEAKLAKIRGSYFGTGEMNNMKRAFKAENPDISDEEAERMAGAVAIERAKREIEMKGASRSTERPMVVNGQVQAVPLISGPVKAPFAMPTPAPGGGPVPAPQGVTAAPPAPGPAAASGGPQPAPTPAASPAGPRPAPTAGGAPPAPAVAGGRVLGMPPAQYRAMLNDIRAVRAGAGQLFGDPNVPDVKGLIDYGDLADNKESRDRLGAALRLTFSGLDQSTGGGGAGVHGEGGKIDVGGIGTWVGNTLGIPKAVANQQAKMFQDAIGALTPREREAYNATISSAEGIIGLRRITGASPSMQSVNAIKEAMPIIGVNTVDAKQFNDKAQRLAVEFSAGTRGVPTAAFDEETRKQIKEINELPGRLSSRNKGGTGPKTAPSLKTIDSQKEFDALPKGTEYIDKADGKRYKKP